MAIKIDFFEDARKQLKKLSMKFSSCILAIRIQKRLLTVSVL